jgi:hypothetical protein
MEPEDTRELLAREAIGQDEPQLIAAAMLARLFTEELSRGES